MVVYETEYGGFGSPEDLLRYMKEEGIEMVHLTAKLCGDAIGIRNMETTIRDVEEWIRMGDEKPPRPKRPRPHMRMGR